MLGVWTTGGNLPTTKDRLDNSGAGTLGSGLSFGGRRASGIEVATAAAYDGTSWSLVPSMSMTRWYHSGCGRQNAALAIAGGSNGFLKQQCEEFNGTSWSLGGVNCIPKQFHQSAGTNLAAVSWGGWEYWGPPNVTFTEEYNGISWSSGGDLPLGVSGGVGFGSSSLAAHVGGSSSGGIVNKFFLYNGSSWSVLPDLSANRVYHIGFGESDNCHIALGFTSLYTLNTEYFDGLAWSADGNANIARGEAGACGGPTASLYGLSFGGSQISPILAITGEYVRESAFPSYVDWVEIRGIAPQSMECEDIRVFGTTCADIAQDKAIVPIKIGEGEVRRGSLYDGVDGTTIENLVKGQTTFADSLHGHKSIQNLYDEWAKRWYYKKIQYKPQAKPAEDQNNGASIIGFKTTKATSNIFPPSSNIDNVDEALYVLALYMKYLRNRTFPVIQETMHTSGRMLNLTFVPLPDNHLSGKWYDGTPVNEDQCSWIVSPAFLWGLGGVHCPWAFLCTTFGLGIGGDNDPNETWTWNDWLRFMGLLLNGQILFGRWLIYFFISSAGDILTALATILATHANYNVVGTHWWGTAEEQKVVDHRTYKLEASNWISTPDISYIDVDKYKIKGSFDGNRDREIEADCGVDGIRIVRIVGCAPLLIPNETIITVTPAILTLNLTKIRFKECYVNDRTGKFLKAQPTGQGGDHGMRADDPYVPPDIGWSPWRNPIE